MRIPLILKRVRIFGQLQQKVINYTIEGRIL